MTEFHSSDSPDQGQPAGCRYMADFAGARLYVYARSLGTVLRVDGEIDALNANNVAEAIRRFARLKTPLILDLSHLDFLSLDGFRALLTLNHEHQSARVHCSVVAGTAMRPLLHIVNDHGLRVVGSVAEALQLIEDIVRDRRQFLSDTARQRRPQPAATRVAASRSGAVKH
jgi:anti-anti-sigma factor